MEKKYIYTRIYYKIKFDTKRMKKKRNKRKKKWNEMKITKRLNFDYFTCAFNFSLIAAFEYANANV